MANSARGVWRPRFAFPAYSSLPRFRVNDPQREFANSTPEFPARDPVQGLPKLAQPSAMLVTVALCTWNRAAILDRTLAEMAALRVPGGVEWELLVVNNNCTDHTDVVISHHGRRLPIRRLFEPAQGVANARNRAVANAFGELMLWTDDDILVDPNWLAAYVAAAERWPEATFFGGPIEPYFEVRPPRWIRNNPDIFIGPYGIRRLGPADRPLSSGELPFGGNMAVRTEKIRKFEFDCRIGRTRRDLISGEETQFLQQLVSNGHLGVWVAGAMVRHRIGAERLTARYIWNWYRGYGRTIARMGAQDEDIRQYSGGNIRNYMSEKATAWVLGPFTGPRWVRMLKKSAYVYGIISELFQILVVKRPRFSCSGSNPTDASMGGCIGESAARPSRAQGGEAAIS